VSVVQSDSALVETAADAQTFAVCLDGPVDCGSADVELATFDMLQLDPGEQVSVEARDGAVAIVTITDLREVNP
jgi:hypothetical protein